MLESINDRFREIFKESGLSQEKFASEIHRSRGEIANIIYDKVVPKKEIIETVCDRFALNEAWLVSGIKPKKREKSEMEEISELVGSAMKGTSELKRAVIKMICSRTDDELAVLSDALTEVYNQINKQKESQI